MLAMISFLETAINYVALIETIMYTTHLELQTQF